jgi:hypothetical protein
MLRHRIRSQSLERLAQKWQEWLYPALKRVPSEQHARVLAAARETDLDTAERIGVIGAVGVAAYLLQSPFDDAAGLLGGTLIQFVLAWPLLGLLVAPWLVRRTRRGLQREVESFRQR